MEPSELVIINDWDKPCARLLMGKKDNGKAMYLNKELLQSYTNDFELCHTSATLEDFGFTAVFNEELGEYKYTQTSPSKVKYTDGRVREWQDSTEFYTSHILNQERS